MASPRDLIAAARTAQAPTVREANPVRPHEKTEGAMSLDEFMKRNPNTIDRDAERAERKKKLVAQAQGQRSNAGPGSAPADRNGRPNVRQTERSQRPNPRESVPMTPPQKALLSNDILREAVKKLLK